MRIDEIAVDGFGLLRDRHLKPGPGLTLIRGENEAGKSTLLAFIRAILFGFVTNGHPALAGGRRGGWLTVTTGDGRRVRIERYGLTGGPGQLRLVDPDGDDLGADLLPRILQGVEKTVYNNVFAFGLAELAQFGNLTSAEIQARIYGAGMGTGATSVVEVENRLEKRRSDLFVKQGRIPRINVLLAEIDALDARIEALDPPAVFRAAGGRQAELEAELAGLAIEAGAIAVARRRLERLRDGWPAWLALARARSRAAELPPDPSAGLGLPDDLPVDLLERLARSERDLAAAATRADELAAERGRLAAERDSAPVDEALLAVRAEAERLLALVPDIRADRSRIGDVERDRADRTAALGEALRRLGPDWSEERLLGVDDSLAAQGAIAGPFRTSLEAAERDLASARLEQAGAEQSLADARADLAAIGPAPEPSSWVMPTESGLQAGILVAIASGIAVAAATAAFGLTGPQISLLILLAGAAGLVSGILVRRSRRIERSTGATTNPIAARREERLARVRLLEQRVQAAANRLAAVARAQETAQVGWRAWLTERGLAPDLDRESAARIIEGAVVARGILAGRESIDARRRGIAARVAATEGEIVALLERLGRPVEDPLIGLEEIRRDLAASVSAQEGRARAIAALERLDATIAANDAAREAAHAEHAAVLAAGGAADGPGLRVIIEGAARRAQIEREVQAAEDTLVALSGPGAALTAFEADLAGFDDVARIEAEFAGIDEEARRVDVRRAAAHEQLGAERDRIAEIEHSTEAAGLRQERADRIAELEVLAETWSVTTIALELLRRTRNRYEREHRPEVLRMAETLLAGWTDGRYARILAPLGKQVQELERRDGTVVPISALSTGTAEQLYLALRFGLVEHFAREAESLPIVMDDILVNFDPGRAERAARSIEELATRHQVLYFTCHPGTPLRPETTIELPMTAGA